MHGKRLVCKKAVIDSACHDPDLYTHPFARLYGSIQLETSELG
jgi:hypothetical protein